MVFRSLTVAVALLIGTAGCGGHASKSGDAPAISGSCDPDILKTGLVAQQTGVSVDAFDCQVLAWTAKYDEPDPMIFKAIMYVESRFDDTAAACPNLPCGTPSGWTSTEAGCLGLMQIVPACNGTPMNVGLLANGQPDMTTDMSSADWPNSIFYPNNNIDVGIYGVANNRMQDESKFSGCTEDEYTLMAVGDYNSYGSTKSCSEYNTQYDDLVLAAYEQYATAAGYPAHSYP
jgi:soluble lytic murein transglycosylase-like protein